MEVLANIHMEKSSMTNILYVWHIGADKYFQLDLKEKIYKQPREGLPSGISQWQQQNEVFKPKLGVHGLDPSRSCPGLHGYSKWICQHLLPQSIFSPKSEGSFAGTDAHLQRLCEQQGFLWYCFNEKSCSAAKASLQSTVSLNISLK